MEENTYGDCAVFPGVVNVNNLPGVGDPTVLEAYSMTELETEAESIKIDLEVKKQILDQLDQEFRNKVQEAVEASEPNSEHLKMEAHTIKNGYERYETEFENLLEEYAVIQTIIIVKRRLESLASSASSEDDTEALETFRERWAGAGPMRTKYLENVENVIEKINDAIREINGTSSAPLRKMDDNELEAFCVGVREAVIAEIEDIEQFEDVTDTINQTLTVIMRQEGCQPPDEIREEPTVERVNPIFDASDVSVNGI